MFATYDVYNLGREQLVVGQPVGAVSDRPGALGFMGDRGHCRRLVYATRLRYPDPRVQPAVAQLNAASSLRVLACHARDQELLSAKDAKSAKESRSLD